MADEPNNGEVKKVEFTPEQQEKVDQLIREAQGRASREIRTQLDSVNAQLATLNSELTQAKTDLAQAKTTGARADAANEVESLKARISEMENARATTQSELNRLKEEASSKAKLVDKKEKELVEVRKDVAIANAASKIPFVNIEVVKKLTSDQISYQDGKWVVLREDGQPRLNAAYEAMSLDEFFNDFAAKNKYLVRGDVLPGTGSTENARPGLTNGGRHELTDIFGPKSNAAVANKLARENPAEYKRLRGLAVQAGILAR